MIKFDQVSKNFGELKALNAISLEIKPGEKMVLLGTSGCGKTTTLKLVNRLVEPSGGCIYVNGENVMKLPVEKLRRKIGYVIQNTGLFPHYNVEENIAVVPRLLEWKKDKVKNAIKEIIRKVYLPESILSKYPHQLSGGQQQRVGLARALVTDPPVVLMDEPLGALDPITRKLIRKEFRTLEAIKDKTVILVTHDVEEAFDLADRICLMDKGAIQQIGTAKELLFKPANQFVRDFFEQQRHFLQLKSIYLDDLQLDSYRNDMDRVHYSFEPRTPVYEVLNSMAREEKACTIAIKGQQETYHIQINQQDLYSSYQKAINEIYHE